MKLNFSRDQQIRFLTKKAFTVEKKRVVVNDYDSVEGFRLRLETLELAFENKEKFDKKFTNRQDILNKYGYEAVFERVMKETLLDL